MSILSIKIGATLDGNFNDAMTGSAAKLSQLGNSIRQLDSSIDLLQNVKLSLEDFSSYFLKIFLFRAL